MIMQVVCGATRCTFIKARAAAFECICQIAEHYYDKLGDYMNVLFQLTFEAIKSDEETVGQNALEFWSTLCESEIEILDDIADAEVSLFDVLMEGFGPNTHSPSHSLHSPSSLTLTTRRTEGRFPLSLAPSMFLPLWSTSSLSCWRR